MYTFKHRHTFLCCLRVLLSILYLNLVNPCGGVMVICWSLSQLPTGEGGVHPEQCTSPFQSSIALKSYIFITVVQILQVSCNNCEDIFFIFFSKVLHSFLFLLTSGAIWWKMTFHPNNNKTFFI